MKKDNTKKSHKINAEKKAVRKPRLTKEEREARKLKLQEERAAKKAARLEKREAKKQKEAEKRAAAKAKREERKAKKAARLLKEKERKAAQKLRAKERAEKKAARLAAREAKKAERKPRAKKAVKDVEVKKVSVQEKIEAERNEWKALSAIRRYVKSNAKALEELDGDKLARKIKKLQKMGYTIDVENGTPISIGYDFEIGVRIKAAKPAVSEKKERKPRKPRAEKIEEVQQPQDSAEVVVPEELPAEAEEKLLSDDEILEAAKQDTEAQSVEVLAGDTFQDETEIAKDDSLKNPDGGDDEELDDEEDDEAGNEDDDILGRGGDISDEQADYRHEAFREMEANGTWD